MTKDTDAQNNKTQTKKKTQDNTNKTRQRTAYKKDLLECVEKIRHYKLICEANIVSIFYKTTDLLFEYDLLLSDFTENVWKVYWQIAYDIVVKEQKPILDEITIGLYLEKHSKLKEKYDEYGGYETILKAQEYIEVKNISGYIKDLHKWNTVLKLLKNKFPIADRISEIVDMSIDEIYAEYDTMLNHIFINANSEIRTYSISDGIYNLIDELDEGLAVGLPYHDMPLLTKEISGDSIGNITLVGALSGVGKSSFVRNTKIPSIIKYNERVVIMINEEGLKKWQREFMVWVANNIYKGELHKYTVRDGKYKPEVRELLVKCADWITEKDKNHTITIIPFQRYETSQAIKIIKKYSGMGVKYFVLDTFKADSSGKPSEQTWLSMQQAMVDINDIIKPESKNIHITITFQLSKTSARQRYYTQENIGMAKNIVDVASTTIMIRNVFDDELSDGKNALKVYRLEGKNEKSKIPVELKPDKYYQLFFIVKNREGGSSRFQIVAEHDLSNNTLKEVGITNVMQDF